MCLKAVSFHGIYGVWSRKTVILGQEKWYALSWLSGL
jgi:hypothetical protein